MKKTYETPQVEVIKIEIEDAILALSSTGSVEDFSKGVSWGDEF